MNLPEGAIKANAKKVQDDRETRNILIPKKFLTAIGGQDGKSVFRGQQSKKVK